MGYRLFLAIAPVSFVCALVCLGVVLRYRKEAVARPLIVILVLSLWLLAVNFLELVAPAGDTKVLFATLGYVGYMFIPLALFSFALRYTGYVKYARFPFLLVGLIIPVLSVIAVATNAFHHLFWADITFPVVQGLVTMRARYKLFFWLAISWNYLMIAGSIVTILLSYLGGPGIFRRQSLTVVAGVLVPVAVNLVYVGRIFPAGFKDYTPVAFAFSGVLLSVGVFVNRLLRVLPVARSVILDEIDTGVMLISRDGILIDVNKAASSWTGLGIDLAGTLADSVPGFRELLGMESCVPPFPETEMIRNFMGKVLSVRIRSLSRGKDTGAGYIIMMNDLTERLRQEEELSFLKVQMVRSEKLAAIGQLAAGVAHEINNPLGYLTSEFRSLKALTARMLPTSDARVRKDVMEIIGSVEDGLGRIDSVVRNLLSFSRQGESSEETEAYDLNQGIVSTLEICRSEYRNVARVELNLGILPVIRTRKNEINQVILNVLTNAAHAIREVSHARETLPVISISTEAKGAEVVCEISNDGPPIPEEIASRMFEPFFTTKGTGGTGLGLSIAKEIVEKHHNGRLELASPDPVRFRLSLPVPT